MTDKTINIALTNNFIATIPHLPIVSELIQDFVIPSIQLNPAEVYSQWSEYPEIGEKITYAEADIGFQIDENWDSYTEVFNFMQLAAGEGLSHKHENRKQIFGDTSLVILDNERNPIRVLTFVDSWVTTLGAVSLDSGGGDALTGILTLQYHSMLITPPDNNTIGMKTIPYETDPD